MKIKRYSEYYFSFSFNLILKIAPVFNPRYGVRALANFSNSENFSKIFLRSFSRMRMQIMWLRLGHFVEVCSWWFFSLTFWSFFFLPVIHFHSMRCNLEMYLFLGEMYLFIFYQLFILPRFELYNHGIMTIAQTHLIFHGWSCSYEGKTHNFMGFYLLGLKTRVPLRGLGLKYSTIFASRK